MTITAEVDFGKKEMQTFDEVVSSVYDIALEFGRQLVVRILEKRDRELMETRDTRRYRSKGKQQTSIKTRLGVIEFQRQVYVDNTITEGIHCVHLLDEDLGIEKIGLISKDLCLSAAEAVCESTYRAAAAAVTESTGTPISAQGVWNIVQKLGQERQEQIERHGKLARQHKGVGCVGSKILYEENDGIWLKLQGKDRKENGPSKEMKVGIAYDGATWEKGANGRIRRTLDNKVAHASFEAAKDFRSSKEGIIANFYDVDQIELRVINGDGANWIQKKSGVDCISVLDRFHRNKKITECVKDREFAKTIQELLFAGRVDDVLTCIAAQIDSIEDKAEQDGLKELLRYYTENKDSLLGYYDRGVKIPETRDPGTIHHARLGSMESNIFTLIGNRMKDRRCCWSIRGANNLGSLLCLKHTTGFSHLFSDPEVLPAEPSEPVISENTISASKIPQIVGKGHECYCRASLPNLPWLKNITAYLPLSALKL